MSIRFRFVVEVECEHRSGKFLSRADMEEAIQGELENADLENTINAIEDGSEYEVVNVDITPEEIKRGKRQHQARPESQQAGDRNRPDQDPGTVQERQDDPDREHRP